VDRNGVWLAVWDQDPNGTLKGIYWSSLPSNGTIWSAPMLLTNANTVAWSPVLSMNADGAAVVAWSESISSGSLWQTGANTRPGTGQNWTGHTVMRGGTGNDTQDPAVAMSSAGEAFVFWTQTLNSWYSVFTRKRSTTAWDAMAMPLETYDGQSSYGISAAANRTGGVIVTYQQVTANNSALQIWSHRYTSGMPWSAPLMVVQATDIETIVPPSVTLDDAGVATAAWATMVTGSRFQVYTGRAGPSDAAWTTMMMENDNAATNDDPNNVTQRSPMPMVRSDPAGNVFLIWRKRMGTRFDLYANRYAVGTGWSPTTSASLLETMNTNSAIWPWLGVGTGGTAVAVWFYASEYDVYANVYR
jgi:hypothetical protein